MRWLWLLLVLGCTAPADRGLTIWHAYADGERAALEEQIAGWNAAHPEARVTLVSVPYDAFPDKISAAIPNGNGPDLFIFAHDRLGDWAEKDLVEPIEFWVDDATAARYDAAALAAMAYRGSLYGLPLAVKSLALFYRTDLVASPPASSDELLRIGAGLTDRAAGRFGLAYESSKLYAHAAWLHGFGGAIFDEDGRFVLASPGAVAAGRFARRLAGPEGIVPAEASATLVATLFNEGRAAMAISGPWFVGSIAEGVPWAIAPLPTVSETRRPAAPFLGAEGVLMSARTRDKQKAFALMAHLASDPSAIARARSARQVVPNAAAYRDPAIAGDPALAGFRAQAAQAVPMPSIPAMRMVWTPYDTALQKIVAQGVEPAAALADAERELESYRR